MSKKKIAHYTKGREELRLNEKRQAIDTNTKMTEVLGLSDKNFKAVVTKMRLWLISLSIMPSGEAFLRKESEKKKIRSTWAPLPLFFPLIS